MPYQDQFVIFWEHVTRSAQDGTFAKLTMAKTIGKPNLKNIFVRPVFADADFKVLVKLRYQSKETEDEETELTLEEAFEYLKPYLKTSFSSVILFTTTKDVSFKINKKGAARIIENAPTFQNVIPAKRDLD
ncbi:hypothetical protein [Formosa algae]|uniref:Uncharacterized protein n=1 Tax=Formosa algae TaxID=225843 RepID=A0A9X0YJA2_9FLAO|nr:hypothetical protein [Formosa algae]MBP1839576.1 hypothetical protein [Formosa algae]MDQ0334880.1 hypothetical protein [Formosa algae]OEI82122.1 hypothetical protein AST99_01395 [Formosa algae]PNW28844.1 hypothetical protein BKP44_06205 [Formosa algae]